MHITVYYCISMFTRENFIAKISQGQSIKKTTTQKSQFVSAIQSGKSQQWAHWSKVGDKLEGQFSNLEYTLLFPHSAEEIFVYVLPFSLLHLIFFSSSRYFFIFPQSLLKRNSNSTPGLPSFIGSRDPL